MASTASTGGPSLYKTELCERFMTNGQCRYGPKCQFAHGNDELRIVNRHPKYKTMKCKSYWSNPDVKYCPYGTRCRFVHEVEDTTSSDGSEADDDTDSSTASPPPAVTTRPKSASLQIPASSKNILVPPPSRSSSRPMLIPETKATPLTLREGKTHMKLSPVIKKSGGLLSALDDIWCSSGNTPTMSKIDTVKYRGAYQSWRTKPQPSSPCAWDNTNAFRNLKNTPESFGGFFKNALESAIDDDDGDNGVENIAPWANHRISSNNSATASEKSLYDKIQMKLGEGIVGGSDNISSSTTDSEGTDYRSQYNFWRRQAATTTASGSNTPSSSLKEDVELTLAGRIANQALLGTSIEN